MGARRIDGQSASARLPSHPITPITPITHLYTSPSMPPSHHDTHVAQEQEVISRSSAPTRCDSQSSFFVKPGGAGTSSFSRLNLKWYGVLTPGQVSVVLNCVWDPQ